MRADTSTLLLAARRIGARIGTLSGRATQMRLFIEAVIIVVVLYIAVRMFRKRG